MNSDIEALKPRHSHHQLITPPTPSPTGGQLECHPLQTPQTPTESALASPAPSAPTFVGAPPPPLTHHEP